MSERKIANNHYPGLDVVRVIAIAGIVLMHVLANGNYDLSGFLFEKVIGTAGNFTILFMMVSAFGMCCGYYEKFKAGTINIEAFYKRRYKKLWPFFALLCILDVVISPSADSVYEIFANLTMLQGLLPNPQISVVGVSWTLAVIFVFYLLFPFFCFLLFSKKRAWLGFIIAGIYNILCQLYFFDEQHSLISIATGGKPHIPFARDCSVFIVIEATVLMMFFMKVEFHSDFINRVAKHVFAVYLFEGALRQIVQNIVFDYSIYEGEWYWPLVNIAVALIAMVGCMSIDVLAQWMLKPFRKAALKMLGVIINISQKIFICY